MKLIKGKRFSMVEVIFMLAVVLVGVAVVSYAGITVPHFFQPNTVAKSSEVNENFKTLADAMPAVKQPHSLVEVLQLLLQNNGTNQQGNVQRLLQV